MNFSWKLLSFFIFLGIFGFVMLAGAPSDAQAWSNPPCYTFGDVNNSGTITLADRDRANQIDAGFSHSQWEFVRADVNEDGDVSAVDAFLIQEYVNSQGPGTFPVCDGSKLNAPVCRPSGDAYEIGTNLNKISVFDALVVLETVAGLRGLSSTSVVGEKGSPLHNADVHNHGSPSHGSSLSNITSVDAELMLQYRSGLITQFYNCPRVDVRHTGSASAAITGSQLNTGGSTPYNFPLVPTDTRFSYFDDFSTTLTAPATVGSYTFSSWSGNCDSINNSTRTCVVTSTNDAYPQGAGSPATVKTVTANYSIITLNPPVPICDGTNARVQLSWTHNIAGANWFDISKNSSYYTDNGPGGGSTWTSEPLAYSTNFTWRVRNHDWSLTGGSPIQSNSVSGNTLNCAAPVPTPTPTPNPPTPTPNPPTPPPGESIPAPAANASCPGGQSFGNSLAIGGTLNTAASIENIGNHLVIAATGTDDNVYVKERRSDGTFRDWYSLSGTTPSQVKMAFVSGTLRIYLRGYDGWIYRNNYISEGNWAGWFNTGTTNASFGSAGPTSVLTTSIGTFRVTGLNPPLLENCVSSVPTPTPTPTPSPTPSPAAIPNPAANATCPAGQSFGNTTSIGGVANTPMVLENIADRLVIVGTGSDNVIYAKERRSDGTFFDWYNVSFTSGTSPSQVKLVFVGPTLRLYLQGYDGWVYRNDYVSEGVWTGYVNTGVTNAGFGTAGPTAVATTSVGTFRTIGQNPINLENCVALPDLNDLAPVVWNAARTQVITAGNPAAPNQPLSADIVYYNSAWDAGEPNVTFNAHWWPNQASISEGSCFTTGGTQATGLVTNQNLTQTYTVNFNAPATPGTYTFAYYLDAVCLVTEESEVNNTMSTTYAVANTPPDFDAQDVDSTLTFYTNSAFTTVRASSIFAPNETMYVQVRLQNNGGNQAASFGLGYYKANASPTCGLAPDSNTNVASLAAGAIHTWQFTSTAPAASGTYIASSFADYSCVIAESNETNNIRTRPYTVEVTNWLEAIGGDMGAVGTINMSNPPDDQTNYMLAAGTIADASSSRWQVSGYNSALVPSGGVYNFFNDRFGSEARAIPVNCATGAIPTGFSYCGANTSMSLTGATQLPTSGSAVIFIDGELIVGNNVSIGNASIIFVVRENIAIGDGVTSMDGIYVAGEEFRDCFLSCGTGSQLVINGSVYANRMFVSGSRALASGSSTTSTIRINYQPRYLVTMRDLVGTPSITWREVAP